MNDQRNYSTFAPARLAEGRSSGRAQAKHIGATQDEIAALKVENAELTKRLALANAFNDNMRRFAASIKFQTP
jgi:hypothetical protein